MSCELCSSLDIRWRDCLLYVVALCILLKSSHIILHHRACLVYPDLSLLHLVLIFCILDIIRKAWHWIRYLAFMSVRFGNLIFVLAHIYRTLNSSCALQRLFRGAKNARRLTKHLYWGKKFCSIQGKHVWSNFVSLVWSSNFSRIEVLWEWGFLKFFSPYF